MAETPSELLSVVARALARRRRWNAVIVVVPLLTSAAVIGLFEARMEEEALPLGIFAAGVCFVAVLGAIEAGLEASRAAAALGRLAEEQKARE